MTQPSAQVSEPSGNESAPSQPRKSAKSGRRRWLRWIAWPLLSVLLLIGIAWGAFNLSPWPAVWITRYFFEQGSTAANDKLAPLVPDTVSALMDLSYDPDDDNAYLDVYYPSHLDTQPEQLPVIVWVHGGAWVATGKEHMENYLRILAGEGYITVGIGYTLAPDAAYPTQAQQVLKALEYLDSNSERFNIDRNHYILGGRLRWFTDSGPGCHGHYQLKLCFSNRLDGKH